MSELSINIPDGYVLIVEENGMYSHVWSSGRCTINQETQKVHEFSQAVWGELQKEGHFLKVTDQLWDMGAIHCRTKDGMPMWINTRVIFRINDPYKAVYFGDPLPRHIFTRVRGVLCDAIGSEEVKDLAYHQTPASLKRKVLRALLELKEQYGIEPVDASMGPYEYPKEIEDALLRTLKIDHDEELSDSQRQSADTKSSTPDESYKCTGVV
jgi:regulator of protease activity HflC (stomatin/prohibitin superfamily)